MPYSSSVLVSHPHQSLEKHLTEVDRISNLALGAKYITPFLAERDQLEYWRKLLVYFHDFGKSTVYFQHKIIQAIHKENPDCKGDLTPDYIRSFYSVHNQHQIKRDLEQDSSLESHAALGAYAVQGSLCNDSLLVKIILLEIIKRHHGDLRNFDIKEFALEGNGKKESLQAQWESANKADYCLIIEKLGLTLPQSLDSIFFQMEGVDLMIDLDSEKLLPRSDLRYYMLTLFLFSLLLAADKGDLMVERRDNIGRVWRFSPTLIQQYKTQLFSGKTPRQIDLWRDEAYNLVEKNIFEYPNAPFYSITLPTGMGKTFTAFNAALRLQNTLAAEYSAMGMETTPRIIYCLPFTSVIDQNAAILEDVFKSNELSEGLLAKHHYMAYWSDKKDDQEELSDSEKEYFTEGWEYAFTVTTFVQLLDTLFSNKNKKLRKFHNLANAIVILDEVQNIPPKYFETVEAMFSMLHTCFNTRFIFVTATQPFLIKNTEVLELTGPQKTITASFFERMNRIDLDVSRWRDGEQPLETLLSGFVKDINDAPHSSFLFIFSLVEKSQQAYIALKNAFPDAELVYLSAAVLPVLRKQRIQAIKDYKGSKQLIVVSTQVVEAGVDIDLDLVYRDFAPLDSINQSAGRCNRNGVKGRGQVRLFASQKGSSVYDGVLLNITKRVLEKYVSASGSNIIPEQDFLKLNDAYATQIRSAIADGNDHSKLISWMKALQFENVSKHFKLIDEQHYKYSVFVNYCDAANEIWNQYLACKRIPDRWDRKKAMRSLRPELLQYVVQIPGKYLPNEKLDDEIPLILLAEHEFEDYYSLETGYGSFVASNGIEPNHATIL